MITDIDNAFLQTELATAHFYSPEYFEADEAYLNVKSWLLEVGSMTKRFESLGHQVTVTPHIQAFVDNQAIDMITPLYQDNRIWQRDITLYASEQPWLVARSLIPEVTLLDNNQQLVDLGPIPLGRYLFSHPNLKRQRLDIAKIFFDTQSCTANLSIQLIDSYVNLDGFYLWARRSVLTIDDNPLVLSELFLPKSPLAYLSKSSA